MSYATITRIAATAALLSYGHWAIAITVYLLGYAAQKALYTHLMNQI